ncbi:tol-pal system YbgF family protein [Aquimarina sp. RZ0]|uniref:tetratricopeptide repeat protein n=1 Tax=Aquimarina sp. RZ0 TaxID=2607730 RepID=UPI0011F23D90|nr:hypothetical protein [Aquimarina sp. RZ0]KAA1247513.1 hypothetical protein F0000_03380 [Aquimarina sp. RZ0]
MEQEERIDKYLKGELTQNEKDQFDDLLKNDPAFRSDVTLLKDLKVVSGIEDREELRKSMKTFETKIDTKENKVISLFGKYKKILVAASILLLVAIGSITFLRPFALDTNKLYASNFEPYKNVVTPIIRGENTEENEVMAFASYESENYKLAAAQFETLFETTKRPYFLLYQANALMAIDDAKKAIPLLEQHIKLNDQLAERGKWYLALAYLKEKRKKESIAILKEIIQKGVFKKGSATQLLKVLD